MSKLFRNTATLLTVVMLISSCSSQNFTIIDHDPNRIMENEQSTDDISTANDNVVIEAVKLPEATSAEAEPIPKTVSELATVIAPADPPDITANLALDANDITSNDPPLMELSVKTSKKYTYEVQSTTGALSILGPNLVYVGEKFDFDYIYPGDHEKARVRWSVTGTAGSIASDGMFTAKEKGTCTVIAADITSGVTAALRVHCIAPGDDVDFIPLVNNIPIANKSYPLPKDYEPGLDPNAQAAFAKLQADAKAAGLNIFAISTYRSYTYQKQVYAGWMKLYGNDADLVSARPGYSEHQLGLAIDVNSLEYSFANTAEGKWIAAHCSDYGFILRYPSFDAAKYTGYSYEPWHLRYVGRSVAKAVEASGKTLEECLRIDSYYR